MRKQIAALERQQEINQNALIVNEKIIAAQRIKLGEEEQMFASDEKEIGRMRDEITVDEGEIERLNDEIKRLNRECIAHKIEIMKLHENKEHTGNEMAKLRMQKNELAAKH